MSAVPVATFDAHSPQARAISTLFAQTLVICGVIGLIVAGLVGFCIYRFAAKAGAVEPKQIHGHTKLEIAWTLVPILIVIGILVLTVRTMADSDPPANREPDVVVIGHQWWWEVRYASGAVTANEIHIPSGKKLLVRLEAADVIHDFWVPQLARKMDAIPGHPSSIWVEADAPGTYLGACAEYCGAQHAWMRIVVVAQPQAEFDEWEQHQRAPAKPPETDLEARGVKLFERRTCVQCHAIGGFVAQGTAAPAGPRIGPDLTHFAARRTIGAGVLDNSPEALSTWLRYPQAVKLGSHMPDLQLSAAELDALVAYFETLR